jgi:hypothetical protein
MDATEEFSAYLTRPEPWWAASHFGDGFDSMQLSRDHGWRPIPSWGAEGADLGAWPLVWIGVSSAKSAFDVVEVVEGDVRRWRCPTLAERDRLLDALQAQWAAVNS